MARKPATKEAMEPSLAIEARPIAMNTRMKKAAMNIGPWLIVWSIPSMNP
nr:hypothetical protein [uncultured archaeon]